MDSLNRLIVYASFPAQASAKIHSFGASLQTHGSGLSECRAGLKTSSTIKCAAPTLTAKLEITFDQFPAARALIFGKSTSTVLAIQTSPFYPGPMKPPELFSTEAQSTKRARAISKGMFLQELARDEILERLEAVNKSFSAVAIVTPYPEIWSTALPKANVVADTDVLDLGLAAYDLVIHAMALHHCNDPVGQVVQCERALRPDGLFMAACFSGQTLAELRAALSMAETDLRGGLSPRVTPMAEIRELGAILQRAGLALPVADTLKIPTTYRDIFHLMRDLRAMGETNIMTARATSFTTKSLFDLAQLIYSKEYASSKDRLNCTFDLVFLSGWAPDASQPKPLKPGSVSKTLQQSLEEAKNSSSN